MTWTEWIGDGQRTKDIFNFIVEYKREHDGVPPTFREIGTAIGDEVAPISTAVITYHLNWLQKQGHLKWDPGKARSIELTDGRWWFDGEGWDLNLVHPSK